MTDPSNPSTATANTKPQYITTRDVQVWSESVGKWTQQECAAVAIALNVMMDSLGRAFVGMRLLMSHFATLGVAFQHMSPEARDLLLEEIHRNVDTRSEPRDSASRTRNPNTNGGN